jgi:hypothetical protein
LLLACGGRAVRSAAPLPEDEIATGPVTETRLVENIFFNRIASLASEVDVSVLKEGKARSKLKGVFLFGSPGLVRVRLYDPFGGTVMDLFKLGSHMQVGLPLSGVLYDGQTPPIGLPPDALYSMEEEKGRYILTVHRPRGDGSAIVDIVSRFTFDKRTLRNTGMVHFIDGREFMLMTFGDYAGRVPGTIGISFFNGFGLSLRMLDPQTDIPIPAEARATIPEGSKRILKLWSLITEPPAW